MEASGRRLWGRGASRRRSLEAGLCRAGCVGGGEGAVGPRWRVPPGLQRGENPLCLNTPQLAQRDQLTTGWFDGTGLSAFLVGSEPTSRINITGSVSTGESDRVRLELSLSTKSSLTLCGTVGCSPPGSSVHGFPRQEHWSGLPFPPPAHLPDSGTEPTPPVSTKDSLPLGLQGSPGASRCRSFCSIQGEVDKSAIGRLSFHPLHPSLCSLIKTVGPRLSSLFSSVKT